jgi:hypothetical protein
MVHSSEYKKPLSKHQCRALPFTDTKAKINITAASMEMDDSTLGQNTAQHGGSGGILGKLFSSCAGDPRGSVHRAWGISLLFVVVYFVIAILESE